MPLTVEDFLSRRGAVEVLCELDPHGTQFGELLCEVSISRPTLANRLAEGQEVELLGRKAVSGERGTTHIHVFAPKGATLRLWLDDSGVTAIYERYKEARKQFENQVEYTQESLTNEQLDTPEKGSHETNISRLKHRPKYKKLE